MPSSFTDKAEMVHADRDAHTRTVVKAATKAARLHATRRLSDDASSRHKDQHRHWRQHQHQYQLSPSSVSCWSWSVSSSSSSSSSSNSSTSGGTSSSPTSSSSTWSSRRSGSGFGKQLQQLRQERIDSPNDNESESDGTVSASTGNGTIYALNGFVVHSVTPKLVEKMFYPDGESSFIDYEIVLENTFFRGSHNNCSNNGAIHGFGGGSGDNWTTRSKVWQVSRRFSQFWLMNQQLQQFLGPAHSNNNNNKSNSNSSSSLCECDFCNNVGTKMRVVCQQNFPAKVLFGSTSRHVVTYRANMFRCFLTQLLALIKSFTTQRRPTACCLRLDAIIHILESFLTSQRRSYMWIPNPDNFRIPSILNAPDTSLLIPIDELDRCQEEEEEEEDDDDDQKEMEVEVEPEDDLQHDHTNQRTCGQKTDPTTATKLFKQKMRKNRVQSQNK